MCIALLLLQALAWLHHRNRSLMQNFLPVKSNWHRKLNFHDFTRKYAVCRGPCR